jgi:hypothetical protein
MSDPWHVAEYRGRKGLEQLEPEWRRLCTEIPVRTVFHTYDAHIAYLDLLMASPDRYRCLAFRDADRVRAIVPLEARVEPILPIPVWGLPSHPHFLVSDVICPEDDARRELLPLLIEYLRRKPEGRPLLVLGPLRSDSVLWHGLRGVSRQSICVHSTMPADIFDCERSVDELMSGVSKSLRSRLIKSARRLSASGHVRFTSVTDPAELREQLEVFLNLEASGWKGESGTGSAIQLHPELVTFYKALVRTIGSRSGEDNCEINSLYLDDRCIASEFCVRTGQEYVKLKIAYDEQYSRLSPGSLLFGHTLERCCNDSRTKHVNCLTSLDWRSPWRPDSLPMQQAHIAVGRLSGPALVALLRFRFGWLRDSVHLVRRKIGWRTGAERARRRLHAQKDVASRAGLSSNSPGIHGNK